MEKAFLLKSIFTLVLLLGFSIHASNSYAICQTVLSQQVELQVQRFGADPAGVVKNLTSNVHAQFSDKKGPKENLIFLDHQRVQNQMSELYENFSVSVWMDRLNMVNEIKQLNAFENSELSYLFTHWVRAKYMAYVQRLVRKRELEEVFRVSGRFPAQLKQKTVKEPASLMVTGYSRFYCKEKMDKYAYDCKREMTFVHTQLSPEVLCNNLKLAKAAQFKYLVQKTSFGFRIVDVQINGRRLYRDSYQDLKRLFKEQSLKTIQNNLKIWSYQKNRIVSEEELNAFKKAILPEGNDQRMPASQ